MADQLGISTLTHEQARPAITTRALPAASQLLALGPFMAGLAGALAAGMRWSGPAALRLLLALALLQILFEALFSGFAGRDDRAFAYPWSGLAGLVRIRMPAAVAALLRLLLAAAAGGALVYFYPLRLAAPLLAGAGALWLIYALFGPGRRRAGRLAEAAAAVLLPWLFVGALHGSLGLRVGVAAALWTGVRAGLLDAGRLNGRPAWHGFAGACQVAGILLALVLRQPILATALAVLVAAQVMLQAGYTGATPARRLSRGFLLAGAAMLLAAWAPGF